MPWCASDTSPGMGRWPPPITPITEMVWGGEEQEVMDTMPTSFAG
jgi:hypothetical protein